MNRDKLREQMDLRGLAKDRETLSGMRQWKTRRQIREAVARRAEVQGARVPKRSRKKDDEDGTGVDLASSTEQEVDLVSSTEQEEECAGATAAAATVAVPQRRGVTVRSAALR